MKWILLRCDHANGGGVTLREFDESQQSEAFEALNEAERGKPESDEVVLFLTESEEMLRRTHSRYFVEFDTSGRSLCNGNGREHQETLKRVLSGYTEQFANGA